jgi:catechol 2,3-dioxygenase-like lactoylglutathione lyase family enzyme
MLETDHGRLKARGLRRRIGQTKEAFIREIVEDRVGRNADREPRSDGRLLSEGLEPSFQPQRQRRLGLPAAGREQGGGVRPSENTHFTTGPVVEFFTDDVAAATEELRAAGVPIISGPVFWDGEDDVAWVHFRAPDGNIYGITQGRDLEPPA